MSAITRNNDKHSGRMVTHSDPGFPGPSLFIYFGDVAHRAVPLATSGLGIGVSCGLTG